MTDWIEWNGGECPVADGTIVDVRHRDGDEFFGELAWGRRRPLEGKTNWAGAVYWHHDEVDGDIVAYRVVDARGASTGAFHTDIAEFGAAYPADYVAPPSALSQQVGGDHYKGAAIQPVEFCVKNKLESLESAIIKRAFRHDKPTGKGREDVQKIIHEAQLLLELKYGVAA